MKKRLRILILVDPEAIPEKDPQLLNPPDSITTEAEYHVHESLIELGHECFILPLLRDLPQVIQDIQGFKPDLVFNLTEHFGGSRSMDMNVAGVLDMLGFPYTGSGPIGLAGVDSSLCPNEGDHSLTPRLV